MHESLIFVYVMFEIGDLYNPFGQKRREAFFPSEGVEIFAGSCNVKSEK